MHGIVLPGVRVDCDVDQTSRTEPIGAADEVFRRIASWYGRCHAVPEAVRRVRAPAVEQRAADWGFRTRDVRLHGDWCNQDLGPLIGYWRDDGRPVALLPNGRGYRMFCPERGETARMDRCDAAVLRSGATMLYRALGEDEPGWSELGRFAAGGGVRDLRLVLASGVGTALVSLLLPVLVGLVLGRALDGRVGLTVELGGAALAVGAVSVAGAFARALIVLRLEGRAGLAVQAAMWGRLLATPGSVSEWGTARLTKAVLGADALRERLVRNGMTLFTAALGGCCQLLLLFAVDVGIGIAASCVLALSCGACAVFVRRHRESQRRLFELDQRLGALTGRLLGGIAKLRAAHAEERAFDRWQEVFVQREAASSAARRMGGLGDGAPVAGYLLGLVSILAAGIARVPHDAGPAAQIVCLATLAALAHFVREAAAASTDIVRVFPQLEEVLRIFRTSTEPAIE